MFIFQIKQISSDLGATFKSDQKLTTAFVPTDAVVGFIDKANFSKKQETYLLTKIKNVDNKGQIAIEELKSIFKNFQTEFNYKQDLFKQFQEWYVNTYIKQKMTDKAKEAQSPFMQNPDPNLVYAQGAGLSKQQEERRSNDLEIAEGFFINKKEKDKKKAA
jgi:hypothetical protein